MAYLARAEISALLRSGRVKNLLVAGMVKKVIADNNQIIYSVESEDARETQMRELVQSKKYFIL